ncbi:MAG: amino acid ABC transporter permease, partial [Zoogloea sp.]|nr:amino acid ABC transporter permease [Zoogloea sp.]
MKAAPRPPFAARLRAGLFATPASAAVSVLLAAGLLWLLPGLVEWALLKAVFRPDVAACRALEHGGACWGVVAEKWRAIIFGRYPYEQQWRPCAASLLILALLAAIGLRWLRGRWLAIAWLPALPLFLVLMGGGIAGLAPVGTESWGGLPLTLLLTLGCMALALPLGVLVAYGR